ncbi:MAG: dienelactone hydrolase family protein [Gammaproteobacteria bacterium]|nr:MAG: dienelactone hydrolase family protein [Gammaproteobacteria bacterium]
MGEYSTLMARDGHEFQAWLAAPPARARGAIVVIQEVFGVNRHIRAVADAFAAEGYTAIAPSLFDRVRRGIELDYSPASLQEGAGYAKQLPPELVLRDLAAARAAVRNSGRAATVGYCWGGTLSYLAACELPIAGAVVYYGRLASYLDKKPKCPVMYHYGSDDASIPPADVEPIRAAANPPSILYVYEGARHGFNCDQRDSYHPQAAALARGRTLDFLTRRLSGERVPHEAARS